MLSRIVLLIAAFIAELTLLYSGLAFAQVKSDSERYTVLQGFIVSDLPVATQGAFVTASLQAATPARQFTASVNSVGFYRFEGLPPGKYRLCAQAKSSTFVDPCQWGGAGVVTLNPGDRLPNVRVAVQRAQLLKIFIDNAAAFVDRLLPAARAQLVVGVRTPGSSELRTANYIGTAGEAREYRMAVPIGQTVELEVKSRELRLLDQLGNDFSAATRQIKVTVTDPPVREIRVSVATRIAGVL